MRDFQTGFFKKVEQTICCLQKMHFKYKNVTRLKKDIKRYFMLTLIKS